jgi:hypothetical protein
VAFFQCFIRGENFPGELLGETGLYGFFTTRWVEAENEAEAELISLDMLKNEATFQLPESLPKPTLAKVYFESIEAIDQLPESPGCGATWFRED